ncbi:MAG: TonB-dependent receptor plug domain-containing protein, partial [Pseudacidovorax sp.]|nr:TonB-dependent receptor plug domain-containing protein [Pseudacidovorax sp.]
MLTIACAVTFGMAYARAQAAGEGDRLGAQVAISVRSQPLAQALNEWARQTGVQIIAPQALVADKVAPSTSGTLLPLQALERILAGSGLRGVVEGEAVIIRSRQDKPEGQVLLPVVVTAASAPHEAADGALSGYVAERSAAATRTDTPILETPQSLSVVGRSEMESRGVQDVMDAVRYTPGVITNMYGPDNRGWEDIQLRGFSTYYSSIRDGLPQTPAGVTYYLTEPYGLERVEVLRGPASMLYGRGDAGGIVSRVSKRPSDEPVREPRQLPAPPLP